MLEVRHNGMQVKAVLGLADAFAREGEFQQACDLYERAGRALEAEGMAVCAIALYRQVIRLVHDNEPWLLARYVHLWKRLAVLYGDLGMDQEAKAALSKW
jgi:tetratricopeptide (TPR) repeat protein